MYAAFSDKTVTIEQRLKEAFGKFFRLTPYQRKVLLRNSISSIMIHPNNVMKINVYAHSKEASEEKKVIPIPATAQKAAVAGSDTLSNGCGGVEVSDKECPYDQKVQGTTVIPFFGISILSIGETKKP